MKALLSNSSRVLETAEPLLGSLEKVSSPTFFWKELRTSRQADYRENTMSCAPCQRTFLPSSARFS